MTDDLNYIRILALDLRSRKFGFAVLEGPRRLLDWGIKGYRTHRDLAHVVQKRISPILTLFSPDAVILEMDSYAKNGEPRRQIILSAIQAEVLRRSINLVFVRRDEVQDLLGKTERATKQKVAAYIVLLFPELTWKLPQERKPWQSEHYNMAVFDAISLALAYWIRYSIPHQNDR